MELVSTHWVRDGDLGCHGNLLGRILLGWLDDAANCMACQAAGSHNMVVFCMDDTRFTNGIRSGHLIKLYGEVTEIGRTSVSLRIEAKRCDVESGEVKIALRSRVMYVQIDEKGNSVSISDEAHSKFPNVSRRERAKRVRERWSNEENNERHVDFIAP